MMGGMRPPLAAALDLAPHPEGGWFRQTWASPETVTLPDGRATPTATFSDVHLPDGATSVSHRGAPTYGEFWLAHTGAVILELGGADDEPVPIARVEWGFRPRGRGGPGRRPGRGVAADGARAGGRARQRLVSPGFDFADFELAAP